MCVLCQKLRVPVKLNFQDTSLTQKHKDVKNFLTVVVMATEIISKQKQCVKMFANLTKVYFVIVRVVQLNYVE